MKPIYKYLLFGLSIALLMTLFFAAMTTYHSRASSRLLKGLRLIEPGMHISIVKEHLGKEMYERQPKNDLHWMEMYASISDPEFLKDKKLYWFYYSTPPCRVIEVYTNHEDRVVYTSWQSL